MSSSSVFRLGRFHGVSVVRQSGVSMHHFECIYPADLQDKSLLGDIWTRLWPFAAGPGTGSNWWLSVAIPVLHLKHVIEPLCSHHTFIRAHFQFTLSVVISAFTIIFQWLSDKLSVAVTLAPVAGLFILNASCPTLISYGFNIKNCGFLSYTCACPACWSSLDDTQTVNESRRAPWEPLTRVTSRPRIYLELHYRRAHRTTGQKCSHRSRGAEKSPRCTSVCGRDADAQLQRRF